MNHLTALLVSIGDLIQVCMENTNLFKIIANSTHERPCGTNVQICNVVSRSCRVNDVFGGWVTPVRVTFRLFCIIQAHWTNKWDPNWCRYSFISTTLSLGGMHTEGVNRRFNFQSVPTNPVYVRSIINTQDLIFQIVFTVDIFFMW